MPPITLRQAHAADWAAVEGLLTVNRLPLDGAREHLSTFVLAQSGLEVVGCAGVEPRGDLALLRSVAVAPGLHRQGIGQQMVSLLLDEARRRNFKTVALLTTTARRWFESFGFKVADRATAPAALKASAEFQGACPASAEFMVLPLQSDRPSGLEALPVAVLGAGPVGLAAAAQLIERGIPFLILEAAVTVGANLLDYGHVRLFSPWRYDIDPAMARLLQPTGWQAPSADELPLAGEVVQRVLEPFAQLPQVASVLQLSTKVIAVTRQGFDKVKSAGRENAPFVIRAVREGRTFELKARAVIDSTGTWNTPNPVGASGLPAIGEQEFLDRIFYGIPDVLGAHRSRYAGRRTLVVGAGHSAANALLALAELAGQAPGTRLLWSVRSPVLTRVFGGGDADALPARGALGNSLRSLRDSGGLTFHAGLRITRIERQGDALGVVGVDADGHEQRLNGIDQIICATGQRPDLAITSELRVKLDPWLESNEALGPLIDPNLHSCGTVRPHGHRELAHPEPGLYTVGVKSYGRAPTFLMATGFEQVRSVVAALAGDLEAADRVELDLPETGVCSVGGSATEGLAGAACCGPATAGAAASAASAAKPTAACGPASCGTAVPASKPEAAQAAGCCGGAP
ncbi:arsenic resistance N-acetyltransferase ArsN2, partial [Variovorax sp. YR752]|uniref:arsenic resistance N-acetyltransferase ArsN2 n=1 Tax=Variovorax sp. YR752 TaxID=1884383 RepID=UPI0031383750